jgi:hypothetical protein
LIDVTPGAAVINYTHPLMLRRQTLGLSLRDVQSRLSGHGFNYSIDMLAAFERGERRFPLENPGLVVAMSQCLEMPIAHLWQAARREADTLRAERQFWNRFQRLRPQNQVLLRFVLNHPIVTEIPGFNFWFELVKSIALQLPDRWFVRD